MATKVTASLSLHQSTVVEMEPMLAMSRYAFQLFDAPDNLFEDQIAPLMEAHGKQLRATLTNKAVSERASFMEDIRASDGSQSIQVGLAANEICWVMHYGSLQSATAPRGFPAGWLVFSSSRVEGCGSAVVDSALGRGAGAPGKCLRCCALDWLGARR